MLTILHIDGCELQGQIPNEIKIFKELKYLDLSSNNLDGKVPSELSELDQLGKKFYVEIFFYFINFIHSHVP